jgi:hypothetical protein
LPAGKRVPGFVQNKDFVPTWLEMLNLPDELGAEGKSLLPCINGERAGNYDEVYLSEATWELKRGLINDRWKFINSLEPDYHGRPMQELYDLQADPDEQNNVAEQNPEVVRELTARIESWVAQRLREVGRETDPLAEQGICATAIGTPVEGETVGAGATPLHLRAAPEAVTVPPPEVLNAPQDEGGAGRESAANTATDPASGAPLHGYVEVENE